MSSGQWEALPQRRRKRRPAAAAAASAAGAAASTPTDIPPHPPQHQQQQQQDTTLPPAPTPPPSSAGENHNLQPSAAGSTSSRGEACSAGNSTVVSGSEDREAEHRPHPRQQQQPQRQEQPCGSGASSDRAGGVLPAGDAKPQRVVDGGGVAELSENISGPAATGGAGTAEAAGGTGSATQSGQAGGERGAGAGGQGRRGAGDRVGAPDAEMVAARHAAVATAVEARSKMTRFAGGLEGGAGADGGSAGANFEYLDHTADVQLHSWGDSIERAMEGALAAMFNTITDIAKVDVDTSLTRVMEIEGHDAKSLLFSLLDEFLFLFHSEGLAVKRTTVNGTVDRDSGGPNPRWRVKATAEGETFDLSKHPQGTEVKAITYSNMQINEAPDGRTDIYVIVDI